MPKLSEDAKFDIRKVGLTVFHSWLEDNNIQLPAGRNLYESIEVALEQGVLTK